MKKYINFILLLFVTIAAMPLAGIVYNLTAPKNKATLNLQNESGTLIASLEASLCDQHKFFKEVTSGQIISIHFDIKGDCHYSVEVKFSDGQDLKLDTGYVTSGSDYKDRIIVKKDSFTQDEGEIISDPYVELKIAIFIASYALIVFALRKIIFLIKRKIN